MSNVEEKTEVNNSALKPRPKARHHRRATSTLFQTSNVDFCIVIDCTDSMGRFIVEIQNKIQNLVEKIHAKLKANLRLAIVCYRDWSEEESKSDEEKRIELYDFTDDIQLFKNTVQNIKCIGGRDFCEDVLGGLAAAVNLAKNNLNWQSKTRVLYHICDQPPHGTIFHSFYDGPVARRDTDFRKFLDEPPKVCKKVYGEDSVPYLFIFHEKSRQKREILLNNFISDMKRNYDEFPNGHIDDPNYKRIFDKMKKLNIEYFIGRNCVDPKNMANLDKMVHVFNQYIQQIEYSHKFHTDDISDINQLIHTVETALVNTIKTVEVPIFAMKRQRSSTMLNNDKNKHEFLAHVAIDFGTDGTGFSYASKDNSDIYSDTKWDNGNNADLKKKTNILLNKNGECIAFGEPAREEYLKNSKNIVVIGGNDDGKDDNNNKNDNEEGYMFFERFKMALYKSKMKELSDNTVLIAEGDGGNNNDENDGNIDNNIDILEEYANNPQKKEESKVDIEKYIYDVRGKPLESDKVFSEALKFMRKSIMKILFEKINIDSINDVEWILTVPAIWSDQSKGFMRQCAIDAGMINPSILNHLRIVYEPDCASLSLQHEMQIRNERLMEAAKLNAINQYKIEQEKKKNKEKRLQSLLNEKFEELNNLKGYNNAIEQFNKKFNEFNENNQSNNNNNINKNSSYLNGLKDDINQCEIKIKQINQELEKKYKLNNPLSNEIIENFIKEDTNNNNNEDDTDDDDNEQSLDLNSITLANVKKIVKKSKYNPQNMFIILNDGSTQPIDTRRCNNVGELNDDSDESDDISSSVATFEPSDSDDSSDDSEHDSDTLIEFTPEDIEGPNINNNEENEENENNQENDEKNEKNDNNVIKREQSDSISIPPTFVVNAEKDLNNDNDNKDNDSDNNSVILNNEDEMNELNEMKEKKEENTVDQQLNEYIKYEESKLGVRFNTGDKYLLCDLGGGTADFACHIIKSRNKVEEIYRPTGGPWGSTYIDEHFFKFFKHVIVDGFGQVLQNNLKNTFLENDNDSDNSDNDDNNNNNNNNDNEEKENVNNIIKNNNELTEEQLNLLSDLKLKIKERRGIRKEWIKEFEIEYAKNYLEFKKAFRDAKCRVYKGRSSDIIDKLMKRTDKDKFEYTEDEYVKLEIPTEMSEFISQKLEEEMENEIYNDFDFGEDGNELEFDDICNGYELRLTNNAMYKNMLKIDDMSNYLQIHLKLWHWLFDHVVNKIINHCRDLLEATKNNETNNYAFQYICMVGGFSDSKYLVRRFNQEFGDTSKYSFKKYQKYKNKNSKKYKKYLKKSNPYNLPIIVPSDPKKAVLDGAARYAFNPTYIESRTMPRTYGICVSMTKKKFYEKHKNRIKMSLINENEKNNNALLMVGSPKNVLKQVSPIALSEDNDEYFFIPPMEQPTDPEQVNNNIDINLNNEEKQLSLIDESEVSSNLTYDAHQKEWFVDNVFHPFVKKNEQFKIDQFVTEYVEPVDSQSNIIFIDLFATDSDDIPLFVDGDPLASKQFELPQRWIESNGGSRTIPVDFYFGDTQIHVKVFIPGIPENEREIVLEYFSKNN